MYLDIVAHHGLSILRAAQIKSDNHRQQGLISQFMVGSEASWKSMSRYKFTDSRTLSDLNSKLAGSLWFELG